MSSSTLFFNGRILTGEQLLSPSPRFVSALLVRDGLVVAAGSDQDLAGTPAERIDLGGNFAMPGFNDAHLHLGEGARLRREVNLSGTRSLAEALGRIASAAEKAPAGSWLTGGGWDEHLWEHPVLPTRHDLDRVTGNRPAAFVRIDVHISIANSAALALGRVTRGTVAPPGSAIDRDAQGEPTGILRERAARDFVERHIPSATLADRKRDLSTLLAEAVALGITSVQDNSTDEDFAALRELHAEGSLPLRISEWLPFDAPVSELLHRRATGPSDRFLRTTMLKAFLDGSLGSRTAALHKPYSDESATAGLALYTQEQLNAMALERSRAGFQLGFHAIGDRALTMALGAFAATRQAGAVQTDEPRFRIEHAQLASSPQAFAEAKALGTIASMQPGHLLSDARWIEARLGPERTTRAYAWRSWLAAGVPLAFGTDYPVEPIDPFRTLYAAVTRRTDKGVLHPEQRLTMPEAIFAYTQGSAYAEQAESWKGKLCPGYVADMVVLDRDLLTCEPESIPATKVLRTVVNGAVYIGETD